MDKCILELIANFSLWKGDTYRLAALILDCQRNMIRQQLVDAGYSEAAELL